jgi:hypothetical protein
MLAESAPRHMRFFARARARAESTRAGSLTLTWMFLARQLVNREPVIELHPHARRLATEPPPDELVVAVEEFVEGSVYARSR